MGWEMGFALYFEVRCREVEFFGVVMGWDMGFY